MQLQTFVVFGLAASTYAVSCWKSGPTVNVADIYDKIGEVCSDLQSPGYVKGEERYKCVYDDKGIKWDFALTNIGDDNNRPMSQAECEDGMYKQIQCEFGGETSYGNWKYRADPNYGECAG